MLSGRKRRPLFVAALAANLVFGLIALGTAGIADAAKATARPTHSPTPRPTATPTPRPTPTSTPTPTPSPKLSPTPTPTATPTATPTPTPTPSPTATPSPTPSPTPTATPTPTPGPGYSPSLRRFPYLTDVVANSATVNWATDTSQAAGYVTYGLSGVESCTAHTVAATYATVIVNTQTESLWRAAFTVAPDSSYCYRIFLGASPSGVDLLGTASSPVFRSQIPVGSTTSFSFGVFGDWGQVDANGVNPDQAQLMAQVAASSARFVVTTGDNGYPAGSQANFGDLVQVGANISGVFGPSFWSSPGGGIPIFPTTGNHGFARADALHPHLLNFPQNVAVATSAGRYVLDTYCCVDGTSSATNPSAWYAFDVGNARFYVLEAAWSNSNVGTASMYQVDYDYHWTPSSPEYQWLAADLAAHPQSLKFAFFHFPIYSDNATETSDPFLQGANSLEGLLGANGVAIAFSGHAHIYQRNAAAPGGLISYVTGGGGATLEPISKCTPIDGYGIGWSYSSSSGSACGSAAPPSSITQVFHFLLVTVNGNQVTVTPTDETGRTFDVQTYAFNTSNDTTPPSVPGGVTATATSATSIGLSWQASTDNVGVAGYTVYRAGNPIATLSAAQTSYTDAGLTPATSYSYTVEAYDAAGNRSGQSSPPASATTFADTSPPTTPGNVTATATSSSTVSVGWQASSDDVGVVSYTVYRSGALLATVGGGALSYLDTGLQASTSYSYTVDAVDGAGNHSAQSPPAVAVTQGAATVLFSDGFESGTLANWTSTAGLVIESTNVHSGSYAVEGNTTVGATYAKKTLPSTYTYIHASVWYRILSQVDQVNLLRVRTSGAVSIGYLYVNSTGKLGLRDDAGNSTLTSLVTPGPGWHVVELTLTMNGTSSSSVVRLDGTLVPSLSDTRDWGPNPIGQWQIGEVQGARTYDVLYDDAEIDVPGS